MSEDDKQPSDFGSVAAHCYADRLVDSIDGHLPLDDDQRAIIRRCAIEVFSGPLEFFFGQMQMQSPQMDGQHSYRFRSSGWPMTHCKGPTATAAVEAAIEEIQRSRSCILVIGIIGIAGKVITGVPIV